jgi:ABC-2 type transport system permease protein
MLRIYRRFWQVNWAEQWQYRANLMMYLLYWLVSPIVYLAVWTTVAKSQGSVSGLTANDFVTYYMVLLIVDQLTSDITIHILAYKIQDGTLSSDLVKPVHPILTNVLVNNLAFKALTFMVLIPVFWTTRVYSLSEFYYALHLLFSGQFVPLTLMPQMVQNLAQYLPFQLRLYFPIQLILGKLTPEVIARNFALDVIWLAIAYGLFAWVWRSGVRRFSAVGA